MNNLWVLEQIKNRPYYMRVTLYIENPQSIEKSQKTLSSFKNYVTLQDRSEEFQVMIRSQPTNENLFGENSQSNVFEGGVKTSITTDNMFWGSA